MLHRYSEFNGLSGHARVSAEQVKHALFHLGVDLRRERFTFEQLVRGASVETEHTPESTIATQIAIDHLRERPDYYDRLARSGLGFGFVPRFRRRLR